MAVTVSDLRSLFKCQTAVAKDLGNKQVQQIGPWRGARRPARCCTCALGRKAASAGKSCYPL